MLPVAGAASPDVLVIGGGVAGLATALRILQAGPALRVTVLEGRDEIGGTLRRVEVAGHRVDVGAESMLATRPEAVDLVREIGHEELLTAPAQSGAALWTRGRLVPIPRDQVLGIPTRHSVVTDVLTAEEARRLRAEQAWPGGRLMADVSVGDYVGTRLGRAVVDRLIDPLLGGVYAGDPDRLSLRATMPGVWDLVSTGGALSDLRVGGGRLGSWPSPFAGLVGGVGRLPRLLAEAVTARGGAVLTRTMACGIRRTAQGWEVTVGSRTAEHIVSVPAVVVATPAPNAARLLAPVSPSAAHDLGQIELASSAVITLAIRRHLAPPMTGTGFLVPTVEGRTIKASTFSANKWAWVEALERDLVFLRASVGRAGQEAPLQRDDEDLVAVAVDEVGQALGSPLGEVVDAHVQRWDLGLPQYAVGHVETVGRIREAVAAHPGLAVAGATYDGVGIPAVIASANRAAGAVLAHLT